MFPVVPTTRNSSTTHRSSRTTREKWTFTWFWSCAVACLSVAVVRSRSILNSLIRRLRTTATDKYATAHDQNHVTVHFSRVVWRLRWVVELFRVVATTENILLVFCRLGNSRISSFRRNVFNSPGKGSEICKLCRISAQIYAFNPLLWLHFYLGKLIFNCA